MPHGRRKRPRKRVPLGQVDPNAPLMGAKRIDGRLMFKQDGAFVGGGKVVWPKPAPKRRKK